MITQLRIPSLTPSQAHLIRWTAATIDKPPPCSERQKQCELGDAPARERRAGPSHRAFRRRSVHARPDTAGRISFDDGRQLPTSFSDNQTQVQRRASIARIEHCRARAILVDLVTSQSPASIPSILGYR